MQKLYRIVTVVLIYLSLGLSTLGYAQSSASPCRLYAEYSYVYEKDTIANIKQVEDIYALEVRSDFSYWYSVKTYHFDSIQHAPGGKEQQSQAFSRAMDSYVKNHDRSQFLRSVPKRWGLDRITLRRKDQVFDTLERMGTDLYHYREQAKTPEWRIMPDATKEIAGYLCTKAQAVYRGRQWVAWFAPDIPLDFGPWKLYGLPGLILDAYDVSENHRFTIQSLRSTCGDRSSYFALKDKEVRETDLKSFLHAKEQYFRSGGAYGMSSGNGGSSSSYDYNPLEY